MRLGRQLLIVPLLGLALSSCGGAENLEACRAWEAYFFSLPCSVDVEQGQLDDGVDCPTIASYPCPATNYFTCLQQNTTCDANGTLISDVTLCELTCDP